MKKPREQLILKEFTERINSNYEWAMIMAQYSQKIVDGHFSHSDILGQFFGRLPPIYESMCFMDIHTWLCSGRVLMAKVEVGYSPAQDKAISLNNKMLRNLPYPFRAEFHPQRGGGADNDGFLKWSEEIEVDIITAKGKQISRKLPPFQAPLEVGYTTFSTSKFHLMQEGLLARWPYGLEEITLFYFNHPNGMFNR